MKEIIFSEKQLGNLNEIGEELFKDENDPRSTVYIRKLNRPKISLFRVILLYLVFPAVVLTAVISMLNYFGVPAIITTVIVITILLIYFLFAVKRIIICSIKLYQRYAPDSLRNKCRFEPSCSEYMILAIEKYGLIKGLRKGIHRLKRCNIDNGGIDLP